MRIRSVTSQCTRAISSLPAARTRVAWNCSSWPPTMRASVSRSAGGTSQIAFRASSSGDGRALRAQPRHARELEHDAQVVELLEPAEVDRQHVPAELGLDAEEAFVAQPKQRLAHRRAAHAEALAELGLGEAVAGDELEVVDLRLQRVVDLLGELAAARAAVRRDGHSRDLGAASWRDQADVRRHHAPALGEAHPGLALPADAVVARRAGTRSWRSRSRCRRW